MKFALITADPSHRNRFKINPETGDATSFMQWVSILGGEHLSFAALQKEDNEFLKNYDVVMMSGHPGYMVDIVRIGKMLKDSKTISIFYPEGSAQLYDNSINGYQPLYYEAWNACDILSIAEEDKVSYYESFVSGDTLVRFIHVPTTQEMSASMFLQGRESKRDQIIVYGDNNPNHPLIALAAVDQLCQRMAKDFLVIGVETRDADFKLTFPGLAVRQIHKQGQYPFLRLLGESVINFYPTEWIGTARHQISCAAVGTPCIGNKDSHTQRRLFPRLGVNIYDVKGMADLAQELLNSNSFYKEIADYASSQMGFYDMGMTLNRLFFAVSDALKKFKQESIAV